MIGLYLAVVAVSWLAFYVLAKKLKLRKAAIYPFLAIYRFSPVEWVFDRVASRAPRLWRLVSRLAVVLGFGMMFFAFYLLLNNLSTYLLRPAEVSVRNVVVPLIPGITIKPQNIPYMLLALAVVLVTHEGMHGVVARLEGIPVKSAGVFLAFVFPGGFVEPDEKAFKSASPGSRMRVAAVGSFANLAVGLVAVACLLSLFTMVETGLYVTEADADSVVRVGEVVKSLNSVPVNSATIARTITLPTEISLVTDSGARSYRVDPQHVGREMSLASVLRSLGVVDAEPFVEPRFPAPPSLSHVVFKVFFWLQLVSLGVAVFNMLPIKMLDGELMLRALLERVGFRHVNPTIYYLSAFSIALLLANMGMSYGFFGLFRL
ncbi:MAG: site-2 protease family protein [Candidatus Caldarchaeum sp.]